MIGYRKPRKIIEKREAPSTTLARVVLGADAGEGGAWVAGLRWLLRLLGKEKTQGAQAHRAAVVPCGVTRLLFPVDVDVAPTLSLGANEDLSPVSNHAVETLAVLQTLEDDFHLSSFLSVRPSIFNYKFSNLLDCWSRVGFASILLVPYGGA